MTNQLTFPAPPTVSGQHGKSAGVYFFLSLLRQNTGIYLQSGEKATEPSPDTIDLIANLIKGLYPTTPRQYAYEIELFLRRLGVKGFASAFLSWLANALTMNEIEELVRGYGDILREEGYAEATIGKRQSILRQVLKSLRLAYLNHPTHSGGFKAV